VLNAVRLLEERDDVRSAIPNFLVDVDYAYSQYDVAVENMFEPMSSTLWNLNNIQAPAAWNISRGENVVIGLLSTGIRRTHTELVGRTYERLSGNFHTDNQSPWTDDHGHGTHIAGTLVGRTVGVAPDARVASFEGCKKKRSRW